MMVVRPVALALAALLVIGCTQSAASPQGERAAAERAAAAESKQTQTPIGAQARPTPQPTLLSSSDLGAEYQFILESFVEPIDHRALLEAASTALRDLVRETGALPVDTAALDFLPLNSGDPDRDWSAFANSYDGVVQRHPAWSLETRPDYTVARTMLAVLDDNHSSFITADETRRRTETSYSGIGVRISRPEQIGSPVVVEVFPSSPAAGAGIRVGDRIVAVGDRPATNSTLGEVTDAIRGPQGSEVVIQLERSAARGPVTVHVLRRPIEAPVADGQVLETGVGYIRIRSFGETTAERVGRLLLEQRQAGARGWILDLRGNPGGSLSAVSRVAGYFMEARPIGIAIDRAGARQPLLAEQRPFLVRAPLVLLVDGDSGSGSEVLAAAFKEYQLATVVGQNTAGSVGIATTRQLSDGSTVQLTISRLTAPSGAVLDETGVQPDQVVGLSARDLETGRDPQLDHAKLLLRQRLPGA